MTAAPSPTQRIRPDVFARRIVAVAAALLAVSAGLVVALALPDTPVSDIAGDALYVVVVWGLVVAVAPRWPSLAVGGVVIAWCAAVELFQLTGLPDRWGAAFLPIMLVLGSVFDPRDLLVYAATAVLLVSLDLVLRWALRSRAA